MTYTAVDKLKCLEREIALRKSVYPRFIASGKLKEDTAKREIEIMEAIRQDYLAQINGSH